MQLEPPTVFDPPPPMIVNPRIPLIDTDGWVESWRSDPDVRPLADRHYNRQSIGASGFVPPGRCMVLKLIQNGKVAAFWVTSYPFAQYVKHAWAGAFVCSAFRNESSILSSLLIRDAVKLSAQKWLPPELGMITFVDSTKVKRKRDFGRCFLRAGFQAVGKTKGGLHAFQYTYQWYQMELPF